MWERSCRWLTPAPPTSCWRAFYPGQKEKSCLRLDKLSDQAVEASPYERCAHVPHSSPKEATMNTLSIVQVPAIPTSPLAQDATKLLRKYATDLLFNHSMRVYLFAAELGQQRNLLFDTELLYIAAVFHDFGLIKEFSSKNERFEVDGANAAGTSLAPATLLNLKCRSSGTQSRYTRRR